MTRYEGARHAGAVRAAFEAHGDQCAFRQRHGSAAGSTPSTLEVAA